MSRVSLANQISVSDLRYCRDVERMTINEIANKFGIGRSTCYRYLGKQQIDVKPRTFADKCADEIANRGESDNVKISEASEPVKKPMKVLASMPIINCVMTLKGTLCNYTLSSDKGEVEMNDGTVTGLLDAETLETFISELQLVRDKLHCMK